MSERLRPVWAEVDLDAVRDNVRALLDLVRPANLCAVVKADGYGHGAVAVATTAVEAGATWVAVALVEEGIELRDGGVDAPILVLSEPPPAAWPAVAANRLTPMIYSHDAVAAAEAAVTDRLGVHVKVDTGMHRVGATPSEVATIAAAVARSPRLRLEGLCTHLAVADEPDNPYTDEQLRRFEEARDDLATAGVHADLLHAANSAGAIGHPAARYDLVRCGIAIYGHAPSAALADAASLRPAMTLKARVSFVKTVPAGSQLSYGLRYRCDKDTTIATVPIGYADGVTRRLSHVGGEVLIVGERRPIAGTITMDQLTVDCGPESSVVPGDEVVLIGRQGDEEITAEEWARALDTISYEVVCGVGRRVPRLYIGAAPGTADSAHQPRLSETLA